VGVGVPADCAAAGAGAEARPRKSQGGGGERSRGHRHCAADIVWSLPDRHATRRSVFCVLGGPRRGLDASLRASRHSCFGAVVV